MPPGTAGQENEPNVWPTLIAVKCKRQKGVGGTEGEKHFAMIRQVFPFLSLVLYAIFFRFSLLFGHWN